MKPRDFFSTIRTEGAILPADLLRRIAEGDRTVGGLRAEDYDLAPGERLSEVITRSWSRLAGSWKALARSEIAGEPERGQRSTPPPSGSPPQASSLKPQASGLVDPDRGRRWVMALFEELGYGRLGAQTALQVPDKPYSVSHSQGHAAIHLVGFGVDLDKRTAGARGAAQASPHGLLQELLNRSEPHLWGLVTNGQKMRLLRDSKTLVKQAYVEFDLQSMMAGEAYSDFALMWQVCHRTRFEGKTPHECWLEKWSRVAAVEGTRALEQLRAGVETAIRALGSGFLAHPANGELRTRVQSGQLVARDFYREILRLVYRMLFLFVAEDRGLLTDPAAPLEARELYVKFYSTARLRQLADRRRGTRHADLWRALRLVMSKLGADTGCPELALPPLGSFLFSPEAIRDLAECELFNEALLEAVRALCLTIQGRTRRWVDYRNLNVEEMGSVYESLLELHPVANSAAGRFELETAGGHERKTSGSYYTPDSLVVCLLDSALDPVLDEAVRQPDPESALLSLTICDPACGSGHFLVAAARRLARRLASVRTGDEEPSPEALRHAMRDVAGRCIFGVDVNDMAVELCKVSLWMETLEPGRPLSFLDAHVKCGNSLLGATPELMAEGLPDGAFEALEGDEKKAVSELRKKNKREREGQQTLPMGGLAVEQDAGVLERDAAELEGIDDGSIAGLHAKEERQRRLGESDAYRRAKLAADLWCAAFVWPRRAGAPQCPTHQMFVRLRDQGELPPPAVVAEAERLARQYQFFHWHLEFPRVMGRLEAGDLRLEAGGSDLRSQASSLRPSSGFSVVLGNPPWERVKLEDREWFALYAPAVAQAANAAEVKRCVAGIAKTDPDLYRSFLDARRSTDGQGHHIRTSGRFPLSGSGDLNTYPLFVECSRQLLMSRGALGLIVPSGVATDSGTSKLFRELVSNREVVTLFDFVNRENLFPSVHSSYKFCLLTLARRRWNPGGTIRFVFWATQVADLTEPGRQVELTPEDLKQLNPNTGNVPLFRTRRDANVTQQIYLRVPVLWREGAVPESAWGTRFAVMLSTGTDAQSFQDRESLLASDWSLQGNEFHRGQEVSYPLYEGKMTQLWDHRAADVVRSATARKRQAVPAAIGDAEHQSADRLAMPLYWVREDVVRRASPTGWTRGWLLGLTKVTAPTNQRTFLPALIPYAGVADNLLLLLPAGAPTQAPGLLANLSSFVFDFVVRQKLGGVNLNFFIVKQLPVLPPSAYDAPCPWSGGQAPALRLDEAGGLAAPLVASRPGPPLSDGRPHVSSLKPQVSSLKPPLSSWLLPRVLELTYTAWDLEAFGHDCGYDGPPYRWDPERRFLLRCELDAAYFHLYGVTREDTDYILDTFPIVRRKDEERHGEYRTKRVILEVYDALAEAARTGRPYVTRLDPPPADPRCAHPGRQTNG
jgi:hypothetical protein